MGIKDKPIDLFVAVLILFLIAFLIFFVITETIKAAPRVEIKEAGLSIFSLVFAVPIKFGIKPRKKGLSVMDIVWIAIPIIITVLIGLAVLGHIDTKSIIRSLGVNI